MREEKEEVYRCVSGKDLWREKGSGNLAYWPTESGCAPLSSPKYVQASSGGSV